MKHKMEVLHRHQRARGSHRVNVNEVEDETRTTGERIADLVAAGMGSWKFIIIQTVIVSIWIMLNLFRFVFAWDSYPFILLNLLFSTQAAYASPLILMSSNRQAAKDRLTAENDYETNIIAKEEIEASQENIKTILQRLDAQDQQMLTILQHLQPTVKAKS